MDGVAVKLLTKVIKKGIIGDQVQPMEIKIKAMNMHFLLDTYWSYVSL